MPCAVAGQDHDEGEGTERDGMCLNMGKPMGKWRFTLW